MQKLNGNRNLKLINKFGAGLLVTGLVAACAEETEVQTVWSEDVANQACLSAVAETSGNSRVALIASDFSDGSKRQAGAFTAVSVGADEVPWSCVVYVDTTTNSIITDGIFPL